MPVIKIIVKHCLDVGRVCNNMVRGNIPGR